MPPDASKPADAGGVIAGPTVTENVTVAEPAQTSGEVGELVEQPVAWRHTAHMPNPADSHTLFSEEPGAPFYRVEGITVTSEPLYSADALQTLTAENARLRERVETAEKERKEAAVFGADVLHEALIATEALLAARQTIERLTEALRPKQLVWVYDYTGDNGGYIARTAFGLYGTWEVAGSWWWQYADEQRRQLPSLEAVKKATQADFDYRARAVLSDEETKG